MKRASIALAFCLLPSLAECSGRSHLITFGVSNLADIVSTEMAIQSGRARERNPIMGDSAAQRVIVKTATTAASIYLLDKIGERHPRAAKITAYSLSAALSVIAVRNWRVAR